MEDLLNKLIVENPDERITLEEYLEHPFFKQYEYWLNIYSLLIFNKIKFYYFIY